MHQSGHPGPNILLPDLCASFITPIVSFVSHRKATSHYRPALEGSRHNTRGAGNGMVSLSLSPSPLSHVRAAPRLTSVQTSSTWSDPRHAMNARIDGHATHPISNPPNRQQRQAPSTTPRHSNGLWSGEHYGTMPPRHSRTVWPPVDDGASTPLSPSYSRPLVIPYPTLPTPAPQPGDDRADSRASGARSSSERARQTATLTRGILKNGNSGKSSSQASRSSYPQTPPSRPFSLAAARAADRCACRTLSAYFSPPIRARTGSTARYAPPPMSTATGACSPRWGVSLLQSRSRL